MTLKRPTTARSTLAFLGLIALGFTATIQASESSGCDLQLSNGQLDYGDISRAQLDYSGAGQRLAALAPRTLTLTATCRTVTAMRIAFKGSATPARTYRMANAGDFNLTITEARLDGQPVRMRSNEGLEGTLQAGDALMPHLGNQLARGKRLELQVQISPRVDIHNSRASDKLQLLGEGYFELSPL